MDPVDFASGAVAPPPAAVPEGQPAGFQTDGQPTAPPVQPAVDPSQAPGAAVSPPFGGVPGTPAQPTAPTGNPLGAPPTDYRALYETQQSELQQARQFQQQFQQALATAQAQAAEEERSRQAQSRIDQAQQVASSLSPEDGFAYLRRVYDAELVRERQEKQQIAQSAQSQLQQVVERLSLPQYARHLAQQHGLTPEYEQMLAMLPDGRQMDAYVPVLKAQAAKAEQDRRERQDLQNKFDQMMRSMQAGQLANSGAHVAGGGGTAPVLPGSQVDWRQPQSLLAEEGVAEFLGLR